MEQKKMEKFISQLLVAEYTDNLEEKKAIMEEIDHYTELKELDLAVFVERYIKEKQDLEALRGFNEVDFQKKIQEMKDENEQKKGIEDVLDAVNKLYFDNKDLPDGTIVEVKVINLDDMDDEEDDEDCLEQFAKDLNDKINKTIHFVKDQYDEYEVEDKVNRFIDSAKRIAKDITDKSYDKALDLLDKTNDKFIQEMESTQVTISLELDLEAVELMIKAFNNLKNNETPYSDMITFLEDTKEDLLEKMSRHEKMLDKVQELKKKQDELRELRKNKQ